METTERTDRQITISDSPLDPAWVDMGTEPNPLEIHESRLTWHVLKPPAVGPPPDLSCTASTGPALDVIREAAWHRRPLWVRSTDTPRPLYGGLAPMVGRVIRWEATWAEIGGEVVRLWMALDSNPVNID